MSRDINTRLSKNSMFKAKLFADLKCKSLERLAHLQYQAVDYACYSYSFQLVCKGIAIALHYFFLVAFAWMAIEGVMLYLMLVKVFHTKTAPTKSKKIFFCFGWGEFDLSC